MTRVLDKVVPFGEIYRLTQTITKAIDALADRLTGHADYFHDRGTSATEGQLAEWREQMARERGDIPWER